MALRDDFFKKLDEKDNELKDLNDLYIEPLDITIFYRNPKLGDEEYYDQSRFPNTAERYVEMFIRLALNERGRKMFNKADKKKFMGSRVAIDFITEALISMKAIEYDEEEEYNDAKNGSSEAEGSDQSAS